MDIGSILVLVFLGIWFLWSVKKVRKSGYGCGDCRFCQEKQECRKRKKEVH